MTRTKGKAMPDVLDLIDFTVNVPTNRAPVILQLTDTQIIDASRARHEKRLRPEEKVHWHESKKDACCYGFLREIIAAVQPDLILLTGDLVYGEFDDDGENFVAFVDFMESQARPWAPVFGNHDNESFMGADWQCRLLESAEHCLFRQRTLTGNGNYTVGIVQGGKLLRVFFQLDSNGCGCASPLTLANGHTKTTVGFGEDQIAWYTAVARQIIACSPETKLTFSFHAQLSVFGDAMAKYTSDGQEQIFIEQHPKRGREDFGFIGAPLKSPWDEDRAVFDGLKALGVDSILVGHEHANSASIVYDGVRLQYGMKSSEYDRLNYVDADTKTIACDFFSMHTPWIGGTHFTLSPDGEMTDPGIYSCQNAGGQIDWSAF